MLKQLIGQLNFSPDATIINSFDSKLNSHSEIEAQSSKNGL